MIRRAACGLLLSAAVTGTAIAANPESGTVSAATPKVSWTGETTGGYLNRMPAAVTDRTDTPCEAPMCDEFALKLEEAGKTLTVAMNVDSDSETAAVTVRITKPDGEIVQADSDPGAPAGGKFFKVQIKNAPVGDYVVAHMNNAADAMSYQAYAEIPAPAGSGGATTPSAPTNPTPPDDSGQTQAIDLQVKVGKASARKLAKSRKLAAKVTVSREVSSIVGTLKKGKKTVGKGSLGTTSGTKTLAVKLAKKKLKPGSYSLAVVASDGQTSASKTVKVKIRK